MNFIYFDNNNFCHITIQKIEKANYCSSQLLQTILHHKMIKNPVEYKNKIYMRNDISLIDRNDQFIVSGHSGMFARNPQNAGYQSPTALCQHNPPINIDKLIDIYCGKNVVFYVTKHDIYSSYVSGIPVDQINYKLLDNTGRKIIDFKKESFEKVILPDNIKITPTSFVKKIVTGLSHSVILMSNNRMLVFGDNTFGQIGEDEDIQVVIEPKLVDMNQFDGKVIDVICGHYNTFVLTDKGILYTAYVIDKNFVTHIAKSINMPENPTTHGFTKVCFGKKIVKITAIENALFFLTNDGFLYGIGDEYFACKTFKLSEQLQIDKIFVKDVWCTRLAIFVLAQNGDVYMEGNNRYHNMFMSYDKSSFSKSFIKCDYLSQKSITNILGSDTMSIALSDIDKNVYISGMNCKKLFSDDVGFSSCGEKFTNLSTIAQKYSGYNINVQNGFSVCSFTFRAADGYTKDLCYMVCNLYSLIFGETNKFSDISFI